MDTKKEVASNAIDPHHYKRFKIEPITFIQANKLNFIQANVIKYVCRYEFKNGIEDLKKLIRYAEIEIERLETEGLKDSGLGVLVALNHFLTKGDLHIANEIPCPPYEADRLLKVSLEGKPAELLTHLKTIKSLGKRKFAEVPLEKLEAVKEVIAQFENNLKAHGIIK